MDARRYAVIGLGLMGRRVAARLARLGHEVTGWNRSPLPDAVCDGIRLAGTPGAAVAGADAVLLLLHDAAAVREVLTRSDLVTGLSRAASVLDMGTNDPATACDMARHLSGHAAFADAPVSGGTVAAEEGTLSIFLGAPPDLSPPMERTLAPLGRVTPFGATGKGQAVKLANQIVVACNIAGLAEALAFAERMDLMPERVLGAMAGGLAGSRVMELIGPRMAAEDFAPHGRATTHLKDLEAVLAEVPDRPGSLAVTRAARDMLGALGPGGAALDHAAMLLSARAALANTGPDSETADA